MPPRNITTTDSKRRDKNGNLVVVEHAEGCEIKVWGKNNTIRIRNQVKDSGLKVTVHGDDNQIEVGQCRLNNFVIEIGSHRKTCGVSISIGDYFSIEPGGRFQVFTDQATIQIGKWCMFSRDITLRFGENPHLIFDLETGEYRDGGGGIHIGEKVWVGEGAYLLKNAQIANESIVAARSVVAKAFFEPHALIGGNPARILRSNIQWFRNREHVPKGSKFSLSIEAYDAELEQSINDSKRKTTWPTWPQDTTLFFGMGAMKSGTTWLHDYLRKNSDVHFTPVKEVHYWDVMQNPSDRHHLRAKASQLIETSTGLLESNISEIPSRLEQIYRALSTLEMYANSDAKHLEYRNYLLKNFKGQKAVGDLTPSYCTLDKQTLVEMSSLAPKVKFIFIMRDPIERLWSAIRMRASQLTSNHDELPSQCGKIVAELQGKPDHFMLTRSDYKRTITALDSAIEPENIAYVFYEKLFTNDTLRMLCTFLGIRFKKLQGPTKVIRKGDGVELSDPNKKILHGLINEQYAYLEQRFGREIPSSWHRY